MKIKELREKIIAAGGEVDLGKGEKIEHKAGGDVDVEMKGFGTVAWVSSDKDEDTDVAENLSIMNGSLQCIDAMVAFAQYIGMEVGEVKPIVVEKQVVVPDVRMSADLSKAKDDWQRSENEKGAEKRTYQWVVSELADKLRG